MRTWFHVQLDQKILNGLYCTCTHLLERWERPEKISYSVQKPQLYHKKRRLISIYWFYNYTFERVFNLILSYNLLLNYSIKKVLSTLRTLMKSQLFSNVDDITISIQKGRYNLSLNSLHKKLLLTCMYS